MTKKMTALLAAALFTLPLTALAGSTAAAREFSVFRAQAVQVSAAAANLEMFTGNDDLSWESHAGELLRIRESSRSIARSYARLQEMADQLTPAERAALEQVASAVTLIGARTGVAMDKVGANQTTPLMLSPGYLSDVQFIRGQAKRIVRSAAPDVLAAAPAGSMNADD